MSSFFPKHVINFDLSHVLIALCEQLQQGSGLLTAEPSKLCEGRGLSPSSPLYPWCLVQHLAHAGVKQYFVEAKKSHKLQQDAGQLQTPRVKK